MRYSGLSAPGTSEQHKILGLIQSLSVRVTRNKESNTARFLVCMVSIQIGRVEGALASGLELGKLC